MKLPKIFSFFERAEDGEGGDDHRPRWIIFTIFLGLFAFFWWASVAELSETTRVMGKVIASSHTQSIQAPDGGVIEQLMVKEGDKVHKGELLATLDKSRAQADYDDYKNRVAALRASLARLQAEVYGKALSFPPELAEYTQLKSNQQELYRRRKEALDQNILSLQKTRELAQSELMLNMPLLASGDVSKADIIRLQRTVADLDGQITNLRNKFFQDAQAEMTKAEEEYNIRTEELNQRAVTLDHASLKAPVDGLVKNIKVTTIGGVVRGGEEVMQLVPTDDKLLIEAELEPRDIAFIATGMATTVKLDAYDYTIYGSLNGKVDYISPDALTKEGGNGQQKSYYLVRIAVDPGQDLKRKDKLLELQPGMSATGEIRTGSKTVLQYLTKPITKTMGEAMTER